MTILNNNTLLNGAEERILYCFGTEYPETTAVRLGMLIGGCTDGRTKAHLRALYDKLAQTDAATYAAAFRRLRERLKPEMERRNRLNAWMEALALHQLQTDALNGAFAQLAAEDNDNEGGD